MNEWVKANKKKKNITEYIDTPEIKPELVLDILKEFKEKTPGPSGITRSLLLNAQINTINMYA